MKLPIYQVDAFAGQPFEGNPAAVVPLEEWLPEKTMQAIAEENNLSDTAFFVSNSQGNYIRWFTPSSEVKLCGHATLAAAYVLFDVLGYETSVVSFDSLSGPLSVAKEGDLLTLDFPSQPPKNCNVSDLLCSGLGAIPTSCLYCEDYVAVFASEEELAAIKPNYEELKKLPHRGVIATAPSADYDFVARFFAPKVGIFEDPVTGSAFTQLIPYWADRLGKNRLRAKQISPRGGRVYGEFTGDRVLISGNAVLYMVGSISV